MAKRLRKSCPEILPCREDVWSRYTVVNGSFLMVLRSVLLTASFDLGHLHLQRGLILILFMSSKEDQHFSSYKKERSLLFYPFFLERMFSFASPQFSPTISSFSDIVLVRNVASAIKSTTSGSFTCFFTEMSQSPYLGHPLWPVTITPYPVPTVGL